MSPKGCCAFPATHSTDQQSAPFIKHERRCCISEKVSLGTEGGGRGERERKVQGGKNRRA